MPYTSQGYMTATDMADLADLHDWNANREDEPEDESATPAADDRAAAIAAKEAELEQARAALVANFNRHAGTSSMRGKQHAVRIDAQIRRGAEHKRTVERLERELTALRQPAKPEPKPVTPEALAAAKFIRTRYGWHKVVKVNRATVTVETDYSWHDRIKVGKILEVRH